MSRSSRFVLVSILTFLCISAAGRPPVPKAEDDFQLVQVADGVFAAIAKPGGLASGNAGFIVGDGGVLVVDTFLTPLAAEELIQEIQARTPQPILYAVNSHYHLDHSGGNQAFAQRHIPIIAQENTRDWVASKNTRFLPGHDDLVKRRDDLVKQLNSVAEDKKDDRTALERRIAQTEALLAINLTRPTLSYTGGTLHLALGRREVLLFSLPGHTGGDTIAYVPDAGVVFTGDLGWSRTLPNLVDATVSQWIPTLDKLLADYKTAKFVPGHGQVADSADMQAFRNYLADLRTTVGQAIDSGLTVEQAREQLKLPAPYKDFAFQNFAKPNIDDMYKEIKGTKK
ncbi:MAG TPA: MBL fold metallo-hydrolase [Blastocatellia bacterium]|nr:MBL fold metallo-hydrolase [Blastocatellia bacterium]